MNELEDTAIAVDAAYYLQLHLDVLPGNEPLLPALGGLTGIQGRIENELDQWKAHKITPFFIFDGQSVAGQDEAAVKRGLANCLKSDISWDLYFNGRADEAVSAFGQSTSTSAMCAHRLHRMANSRRCLSYQGTFPPPAIHLETARPALPRSPVQRRCTGEPDPLLFEVPTII